MASDFVDPTPNVAHRPWPLPQRPWIMTQRWSDLLFLHWPVPTDAIRALVPRALDLDLWYETAWLTITPLWLSHLRLRGLPPLPWTSEFAEINVRTYASVGGRAGVYFFSLDAARKLAVLGARLSYDLPYYHAQMSVRHSASGTIEYDSRRPERGAIFSAGYAPDGPVARAPAGTLDHWLTERYCLYVVDSRGVAYRGEIHHDPWPLQPARIELRENTMATAAGITLPGVAPRCSFARSLDVVVWSRERVR